MVMFAEWKGGSTAVEGTAGLFIVEVQLMSDASTFTLHVHVSLLR
jgi:hypothetical protein